MRLRVAFIEKAPLCSTFINLRKACDANIGGDDKAGLQPKGGGEAQAGDADSGGGDEVGR